MAWAISLKKWCSGAHARLRSMVHARPKVPRLAPSGTEFRHPENYGQRFVVIRGYGLVNLSSRAVSGAQPTGNPGRLDTGIVLRR